MIVLDTHALVYDALSPERLGPAAAKAIDAGDLACSDISLWEIAMLVARGRLDPGMAAAAFIEDVLVARNIRVLPITPAIAALAQDERFRHGDPADRLIAATSLVHQAALVTADQQLQGIAGLATVW